ncbi:hypothetical protein EDB94_4131 [Marinobacter sp. 3-2]|jgi:hypothetical protein|uniref:hypothetical protein n=1 Tax=Marinobacter sp. 3-2 TaxID=2485141 RepID=UPI000D3C6958|nr:hypothetical protein [Marinobacter sp. 3-2]ROQ37935.1 hypothetical protein EDB94_4131 [Marinobacter sp. 3-2]
MKKLLFAMLALTICLPVQALEQYEPSTCMDHADMATVVMEYRQTGQLRSRLIEIIDDAYEKGTAIHSVNVEIVNQAYLKPVLVDPQAKQDAVHQYAVYWYNVCQDVQKNQ